MQLLYDAHVINTGLLTCMYVYIPAAYHLYTLHSYSFNVVLILICQYYYHKHVKRTTTFSRIEAMV